MFLRLQQVEIPNCLPHGVIIVITFTIPSQGCRERNIKAITSNTEFWLMFGDVSSIGRQFL
ncbi:hypothetical protein PM082_009663 [Marasmius tenuissimus]|nr:hypothetical protein PM082_009663 [Marasmius tenuissimus]